jgi:hypothetical protein
LTLIRLGDKLSGFSTSIREGTVSKAAADTFALAAKATRDEFDRKVNADHVKFVKGNVKPTMADAEALRQHIEKYDEICRYMRDPRKGIPVSWGGAQDTEFKNARTLLETLKRLAK